MFSPLLEKLQEETAKIDQVKRKRDSWKRVTEEEIAVVVSKWTGIPVSKLVESEKGKASPVAGSAA